MSRFDERVASKSFLSRLVTSPEGKGFMDSPLLFFLITALNLAAMVTAVASGALHLPRSTSVIYYRQSPRGFFFGLLFHVVLGGVCALWGWRKWRDHGE